MSWWEALFLAVIEGLTEFLPVSSTGHLVLASSFLGIAKETFVQDFEIIIQGGAILAVVVHSFSRLWQPKLYVLVGAAFVPTALMGYFLHDYVEAFLDRPLVVAGALIGGGVVLLLMDRWFAEAQKGIEALRWQEALGIGLIQGISLVPGVSRAAAALFGGRLMGLSRQEAAEFSFLLAVPTLGAAAAYKFLKSPIVWTGERTAILLVGMAVAFLVALAAMRFLIAVWMRWGMRPFGWYRIALGIGVWLVWAAGKFSS
jgi:undecaprenyl-diphosphatase